MDLCREIRLARFCDSPLFDSRLMSFGRFSVTDSAYCTAVCTVFLCLNMCCWAQLAARAIFATKGGLFFFFASKADSFASRSFLPEVLTFASLRASIFRACTMN